MKAIYFGSGSNNIATKLGKNLLHWGSNTLTDVFPKTSVKLSEHLLCSPTKPKRNRTLDDSFQRHEIEVLGHRVRLYSKGDSDKAIFFVHGWSGQGSNYKRFMKDALKNGYSVWTMDHVGHGESSGIYSNFFLYVAGLEEAYRYARARNQIVGMVGHSMGASAIISAHLPEDLACVLLAPVIPFFENMQDVITGFGISPRMIHNLFKEIEGRTGRNFDEINPRIAWTNFKNPRMIFHDVKDPFIPLEKNLETMSKEESINLNVTNGLGHFRILHDSSVIYQSMDFFNQED